MAQRTKWSFLSSVFLLLVLVACNSASTDKVGKNLEVGQWRMEMKLEKGQILPFAFHLTSTGGNWNMKIMNGEEVIVVDDILIKNDSLIAKLPVFDSEFRLKIKDNYTLKGEWINYYKSADYKIEVRALFGESSRFSNLSDRYKKDFSGKYEVTFSPGTEDAYKAIGLFQQEGNKLFGTFATETGDYRHLSGNLSENKMMLSTFDGSHAFLFNAEKNNDSLVGVFYSGTHWKEPWVAFKNKDAKLKNPDSLTYLNEGYEKLSFSFPNIEGTMVSLDDETYKDKAVIVQIMGSWCPNCLDETKYLSTLYDKYNSNGLEVIAIAFERTRSEEKAINNLKKLQSKTGANYQFLLGGATRKDKANEKLPMLNHVMSYPTAIFIDKSGSVRRIHTGFYGPSTGEYYTNFVEETERLVEEMLNL